MFPSLASPKSPRNYSKVGTELMTVFCREFMGQHRLLRTQPHQAFDKTGALRTVEYTQQGTTPPSVFYIHYPPSGDLTPFKFHSHQKLGASRRAQDCKPHDGLKLKIRLAGPLLDGQEAGG